MFGVFRSWFFGKPRATFLTKVILIILVFLFLGLQMWTAWQLWQLKKQVNDFQAESRQKIDQIQSSVNYSSSLLWMLKGQMDQLPYQINQVKK